MVNPLNGNQIRGMILRQGYSATEAAAYSWGNITQGIVNTGKGVLTAQCGNRVGSGTFKAVKDFGKGDVVCGTLCSISIGCEAICATITNATGNGKIHNYGRIKRRFACIHEI